jgi:hypothetical protein
MHESSLCLIFKCPRDQASSTGQWNRFRHSDGNGLEVLRRRECFQMFGHLKKRLSSPNLRVEDLYYEVFGDLRDIADQKTKQTEG